MLRGTNHDSTNVVKGLERGARLGPYEIQRQIGVGGMGEVYAARDTRLGRTVAIKVLVGKVATRPDALPRFEREARAVSSLNHPNICTLYDIGHQNGLTYLVMEYLEGKSLAERLSEGPLLIEEVLRYTSEIASALGEAHRHGIVHRDLKPANVVLTKNGAKLLDFGIAKLYEDRESAPAAVTVAPVTQIGDIIGTPNYMAPEQLEGRHVDARSDFFAFGVVVYEMVAGRRPFEGPSQAAVIAAVMERQPPPLSSVRPGTPSALQSLVDRCLHKDPMRRFPSADALVSALADMSIGTGPGQTAIKAVAVLPLENLSRDPEQEYFADGMTDALITTLAQVRALRVISRTSVMRYKGVRKPLPEIARELNVEAVIEGTVMRSGDRVRIGAQLIDAASDTHLWGRNYETDVRDVLLLQTDVARAIVHEVQIQLTPQEQARLAGSSRVDPEAYEAFLKGRHHWYRRTPGSLDRALEYLQRAVDTDPTYALAHAGLADAYITLGWDLFGLRAPSEMYPRAKEAAKRALQFDPNCAEAHAALGWAATGYDWDWLAAEAAFRRAIELKPQYGPLHIWYSHLLKALGRTQESSEESLRALECDPLGLVLNAHMGWHYLYLRQYQQAIGQLLKTLELDSSFILTRMFLGEAYEQVGMFADATAQFQKAVDLSDRRPINLAGLGHSYAMSGEKEEALKILEELKQRSLKEFVSARGVAEIYVALDDHDEAFAWLFRAFEQRNGWLLHIKENPRYDRVRADPRYDTLVRRLNLT
jgi:eukaryotic-like serine/threonine-protein kinase